MLRSQGFRSVTRFGTSTLAGCGREATRGNPWGSTCSVPPGATGCGRLGDPGEEGSAKRSSGALGRAGKRCRPPVGVVWLSW